MYVSTVFCENPYCTPYMYYKRIFFFRKKTAIENCSLSVSLILKYNKHGFQTGPVHTAVYLYTYREMYMQLTRASNRRKVIDCCLSCSVQVHQIILFLFVPVILYRTCYSVVFQRN